MIEKQKSVYGFLDMASTENWFIFSDGGGGEQHMYNVVFGLGAIIHPLSLQRVTIV